ncbi:guanylate kinase [Glaciecola petra]|uniref:Guanylate kinase n=1 Tax=Glaciecola petra TaxID=3075602 RepID=A0ABU2ZWE1_9ALTE|nr:guanylate kinase [Aestuariibacter sp. P117]MDT0596333.1 guanylate kinase [Aestuariibacter sp. P117]
MTPIKTQNSKQLGNLFIVAAPSGAGKSSLISALIQRANEGHLFNPAQLSVSHTTRTPREGEEDGQHYHFVSKSSFEELIEADAFYEYAEVFGNYYGTSKSAIADKLIQGVDVFLDIDWQGARQVKAVNPEVISVFVMPPSEAELNARLVSRGKDAESVINDRMQQAKSEMQHYNEFDYVIVNDNFARATEEMMTIVKAASLLCGKQEIRFSELFASLVD